MTKKELWEYMKDCGPEAAADLLLLGGPDNYAGDYEKTMKELDEMKGEKTMGKQELEKMVTELKELESFKDEIAEEIEAKKDALKAEMDRQGKDEMQVGIFKLRYKEVETTRFDGKTFKATHEELYNQYTRTSKHRRFTVN